MSKHVLFMPDGNRRYAKREGISLRESYNLATKSFQLLSDFFLLENDWNQLTMHLMSKYTHERIDGTLPLIYDAFLSESERLLNERYFPNNNIKFKWIDHSSKLPSNLVKICQALEEQSSNGEKVSLNLVGYDVEADEKQAFEKADTYEEFLRLRMIPEIDLVLRTTEMRPSKGPVYAMSQAQMILINKLSPEIEREDLERVLEEYNELKGYRKTISATHR